jgi:hypothetical protein
MTGGFGLDESPLPTPPGGWHIGVNVPWSVAWTGEQEFDLAISAHFPGLVDLTQRQRPGTGTPRFKALHVTRHRYAMAELACHVCGRPTSRGDRYLFPVQSGAMVTMPDESTRYAANVPPVHRACAVKAAAQCPHLRAHQAAPVAYPAEPSRLMPRTDVVEGMESVARLFPRHLPLVFTCYRLFGPKFSHAVGRMRA